MERLNKEKRYNIRFMPNIHNPKENTIGFKMKHKESKEVYRKNISYILINNEIKPFIIPKVLEKNISLLMTGDLSLNSDNIIVGNSDIKYYSIDKNGNIDSFEEKIEDMPNIKSDIKYINKPFNVFDIKSGYDFSLDKIKINGFTNYINIRFNDQKPLYQEGNDKKEILDMYIGVETLEKSLNDYMTETKENNPNLLFNEEIDLFFKNDNIDGELDLFD